MLHFTFWELSTLHSYITPQHVYTVNGSNRFGLERKPHITLLYGLNGSVTAKDVSEKLQKFNYSGCKLNNVSLFKKKYDVLKFDVSGSGIVDGNEALTTLPHVSEHNVFNPHLTVAYLTKGMGDRYVNKLKKENYILKPSYLEYTNPNGRIYKLHI
tara:strand:+ start:284 stop:751 length:468 start_codon:yes stop_codon:yes gene_type:complete